MTAIGLSDEYIADREISKRFFCSVEGVSGRFRAMMLLEAASAEASVAGPRRPSPPHPLAVSMVLAVIPAPASAGKV